MGKTVPIDSLLASAGYEFFEARRDPPQRPDFSDVEFSDIHPGFSRTRLAGRRMYVHQLEAYQALMEGSNVIMVSGTGSGKTEAWVAYVARMAREGRMVRVMAVYPTLALAWDQLARLKEYSEALSVEAVAVDSVAKREVAGLKSIVRSSWIVATNPAMLLMELKKYLVKPGSSMLTPFIEDLDLLVIDELDFYGPREVAILLGMIELLNYVRGGKGGLKVAVLTATLANPEDLAGYLSKVTGRETRIVRGKPFRAENRVLVVLGKRLEDLRRALVRIAREGGLMGSLPREIEEALNDKDKFVSKAYLVVDYFRARGLEPPSIALDPVEILGWLVEGKVDPEGLTLVFTRSINEAERLVRQLKEKLGSQAPVAAHHHLVSKDERKGIEESARRGELRVIVTPRTLAQGIDIGSVVRVVHYGLPSEVREFWQREGRKGRREGVKLTESIIIPVGRWDRTLLQRGAGALSKWISLALEKVEVNPDNHYKALLTGLAKLISPILRQRGGPSTELTDLEAEALRAAGVLREGAVDQQALTRTWSFLGFYEYGPPYGVKRVLAGDGGERRLEEVGRCDLVEKFQPGSLDPANDAIVIDLTTSRGGGVSKIVEKSLKSAVQARHPDWLLEALENYADVKRMWGEKPRFLVDTARGFVESEVEVIVHPPRRGFGLLTKVPYRTLWIVRSEKLKAFVDRDGRVRVLRPSKAFTIATGCAGRYRDFTYGIQVEAPNLPPEYLRLGLAVLGVYLRRVEGVPLGLIKYSVYVLGEKRLVEIHEESCAGLIMRLDWGSLSRRILSWTPDDVDEIMMLQLDEYAHETFAGLGYDWGEAIKYAAAVADMLNSWFKMPVKLGSIKLSIPKPSRSLRVGAVALISHPVEVRGIGIRYVLAALAYFDGANVAVAVDLRPMMRGPPPESLSSIEYKIQSDVVYSGFRIYSFDRKSEAVEAERAGLALLKGLIESSPSVKDLAAGLGLDIGGLEWLKESVEARGFKVEGPSLAELREALEEPLKKTKVEGRLRKLLESYVAARAKLTYLAALALEQVKRQPSQQP